ncbi:MAG: serine hydrolase [Bdellovibrionales bacterium]
MLHSKGFRLSALKFHPIFLLFLIICLLFAQSAEAKSKRHSRKASPPPYSDIVIDAQTGEILHEQNASSSRYPASLTKMLTLYVVFEAIENRVLRLDSMLPVSGKAAAQPASKLGLRAGDKIRAYDAIMSLVTESANDSAVVLAEALGGSIDGFSNMMMEQARTLGMRQSVFKNPNGLPDNRQKTTARDMAILGHALIYHYPGFYTYFSRDKFTYKGKICRNHNHLMSRYPGMDGIKTGFINASGFNLVASAIQDNRRVIGVIFGGRSAVSRDKAMEKLLDEAFNKIKRPKRKADRRRVSYLPLPSKVATAAVAMRQTEPPEPPAVKQKTNDQRYRFSNETAEDKDGSVGWGIQVGAFGTIEAAQYYLTNITRLMAPLLGKAEPSLQKVTLTDGTALYRTRFMGIDKKTARNACSYMVKHGQSCLVVTGP